MKDLTSVRIETARAALALWVDSDGRLLQGAFGAKCAADEGDAPVAFPAAGDGWYYEPALRATHVDGNTSTDLRVVETSVEGTLTKIALKDPEYPFFVDLYFRAYPGEDIFEAWTEIRHEEEGEVVLEGFASSSLDFGLGEAWVTQFHGDWADEANMLEEKLGFGQKILDSKLGVRAQQFRNPLFLLARGGPAEEDSGEVVGGSLAWSGSFQFVFERMHTGRLRVTAGMNPYASAYRLALGERFATPRMVWAWSDRGTGELSRHLHRWTRKHAVRDGERPRAILLNNWEATYFDFDEKKIVSLFDGAKALGMELFLLDDGWFGVKHPRDADTQGLGDWIPDPKKLPNGIGALTSAAAERGLRFGIWLEPEMVNPKSELFETHPEWAIQQPKRTLEVQRNQLVLDLARPETREYVFEVADRTLRENPGISFVKWDCNRYLTQPGSTYLGKDRQSHLWIDYGRALYDIFARLAERHPHVDLMMCSGGGGRVDHGALRYAHEFWPSDRTDPARRIFIQWGFGHFFPPIAMANHVTDMGERPMKFAFDVAMSGRLGMDVDVDALSPGDRTFAARAIEVYKGIRDVVQLGDQYRLESPYAGPRSGVMSVRGYRAALFVHSLGASPAAPLVLKGLDPTRHYQVQEVNLPEGTQGLEGEFSGVELLTTGLPLPSFGKYESAVFELTAA